MKKVLFPILALLLALGLALPVAAHTEGSPQVQTLYAGQDIDVGTVSVWNDSDNLYVKYQTTGGWEMTETHLEVADTLAGIPQTTGGKKGKGTAGNPIPGHFSDGDYYDPPVTEDTFTFNLADEGWEPCNTLYIAAHAVVEKCETESFSFVPVLAWNRSSEDSVAVYPGYGAQWTQVEGFAIPLDPATLVWDGGTGSQYFTGYSARNDISWASWECTQNPSGKSTTGTDLRRFQTTFDIPVGYSVTGGTLGSVNSGYENVIPMNDNIYIFVNEELIFWGGTISLPVLDPTRTHFLGMERRPTEPQDTGSFPETDGWHMDGAIPEILSSLFVEGENVLDVFAEELWTGGGMHELGLTLEVEETTCETETAWGDGLDFPGKNWATYFEYHVQGELAEYGSGIAEWSDEDSHTGDYSWKLYVPDGTADMAAVAFECDIALEDITTLTFWKKVTGYGASGWNPSVILLIDADDDGDLELDIYDAMEWHFTWVGTLLGDDAFVECESPTGLTSVDTAWSQLDAFAMSAWGADSSGVVGLYQPLTLWQSNSAGVIDPTDKVLMVAIVIGGAGSWMDETAYVDDIVIAGP